MDSKKRNRLIKKSRNLRKEGYSLGKIASCLALSKSTVHGYVRDIMLTRQQKQNVEETRKAFLRLKPNPRKGKCIPGRTVVKPKAWSKELVHVVAHFMFDGYVRTNEGSYYSSCSYQIDHIRTLVKKIFNIEPKYQLRKDGTAKLSFYYVEFADYLRNRMSEVLSYLGNGASTEEKRIFLQAFFDDEGNVYCKGSTRRVRGYQKSIKVLSEIKRFLGQFRVDAVVNRKYNTLEITGRDNLVNFAKDINFSPGIFINPRRKNSIWEDRIEKREILNQALKSYK